jgi:predicted cobalt transporter CbtA
MLLVAAMIRLSGLLLALMFSVMPTVDIVCRALCTPEPSSASPPSCHDVAAPTPDGVLLPAVACQRDASVAVAPADGTRNLVPPAPIVTARFTTFLDAAAPAGADMHRLAVRQRPPQAYPSTIVLRI